MKAYRSRERDRFGGETLTRQRSRKIIDRYECFKNLPRLNYIVKPRMVHIYRILCARDLYGSLIVIHSSACSTTISSLFFFATVQYC